ALGEAIHREPVAVDERDEPAEPERARRERGLPRAALVALAVAQQAIGPRWKTSQTRAERHAHREAEAVAERSGGRLDAGHAAVIHVHPERAPGVAEGGELLLRDEASLGEHRGEAEAAVALGEDEPIPLGPRRALRIDLE